jgi:penicillin amidase
MLFAEVSGRVGRVTAAHLPQRTREKPDDVVVPADGDADWSKVWTAKDLPWRVDPDEGFMISANERPEEAGIVIGFHFSPADRKERLEQLIRSAGKLSVAAVERMQQDVHSEAALAECHQLVAWLRTSTTRRTAAQRDFVAKLAAWDGNYAAASRGALAFELLSYYLARALLPAPRRAAYEAAWGTRALIWEDVLAADPVVRRRALDAALGRAAKNMRGNEAWCDRHRLRLSHPLAMVPLIGRAYRLADRPTGGSSETVMKTAHGLTDRRLGSRYGSGARHISDLSDPDANFFALLGGQDGWLGSNTQLDQLPLWERGEYVTVPLRAETAQETFPLRTELRP